MKLSPGTLVALALAVLAAGVVLSASRAQGDSPERQLKELEAKEKTGGLTLAEHARRARLKGERQLTVSKSLSSADFAGFKDFETAAAVYTILVASPVVATSYVNEYGEIGTSYKFRTLEVISEPPPDKYPFTFEGNLRDELLPLGEGEFVVSLRGGTATIDGVEVTTRYDDIEPFSPSAKYLLFLSFDTTRRIGGLSMGPKGALLVNDDGTIETLNKRPSRIKQEVDARYHNSIDRLKADLKGKRN